LLRTSVAAVLAFLAGAAALVALGYLVMWFLTGKSLV
jgi:hypothetical protein